MAIELAENLAVERLAKGLVGVLETYSGTDEVFEPDAFFDINVPTWRFQMEGPQTLIGWLREYCPDGYRIAAKSPIPTATGFVLEVEGDYADPEGNPLFFRNLYVCKVQDGRITELTFWCTGDWDVETREHHRAEVQLIRP